jgi:hypothetical protein
LVEQIGGSLVTDIADAHKCTHVLVEKTRAVRCTSKLRIGLCVTHKVVGKQWLIESGAQGRALPVDKFLAIDDIVSANIKALMKIGTRVLQHWNVYKCKGVPSKKPPDVELKLIVQAAGANWLDRLPSKECSSVLLLTSDPETKAQTMEAAMVKWATKRTITWFLNAMMTQQIDL